MNNNTSEPLMENAGRNSVNDEVIIVKLEENPIENPFENVQSDENIVKLKLEKEILQREKENSDLKITIEKMQHEKEKLEKDFKIEKLKSENALLKAEINVKTISDNKRQIEEELNLMKNKRLKFEEEKAKFQNEIVVLNQKSQNLIAKNSNLLNDNIRFQQQLTILHQEKENAVNQKKTLEDELKATKQLLQFGSDQQVAAGKKKSTSAPSSTIQRDFSRMPFQDLVSVGVAMVIQQNLFPDYQRWYNSVFERIGKASSESQTFQDFFLFKGHDFNDYYSDPIYYDVEFRIPYDWKTCNLIVKILHKKDNRKQVNVERLAAKEWLITGLTEDYFYDNNYFLVLVKQVSG